MVARACDWSAHPAQSHARHFDTGEYGQLTCAAFDRQGSLDELPLVDLLVALPLLSLRGCVVLLFNILLVFIIFLLLLRLTLIVVVRRLFAGVFAVTVAVLQRSNRVCGRCCRPAFPSLCSKRSMHACMHARGSTERQLVYEGPVQPAATGWRGSARAAPGHGRGQSRRSAPSWCDRRPRRPSPLPQAPQLRPMPCQGKNQSFPLNGYLDRAVMVLLPTRKRSGECCVDVAQAQMETCAEREWYVVRRRPQTRTHRSSTARRSASMVAISQ